MKKFVSICLCLAGLMLSGCGSEVPGSSPTDPPQSEEVQVVLLLGQSNAEGHTFYSYLPSSVGQEKYRLYAQGFEDVKISFLTSPTSDAPYGSNGEFVPVRLGQGVAPDRFGPEIGMAEKIAAENLTKKVYIIKYTYGGTTLFSDWRSTSGGTAGKLYVGAVEYALAQCEKLESMGLKPVIKAICWMQGETDACGQGSVTYEELEGHLVKDLRRALKAYKPADSEIGFIDGGISDSSFWTYYQQVNNAKRALAAQDEYHDYIDTIAAGLTYDTEPAGGADLAHYDSKAEIQLGHLFAQVLLEKYLEK